MRQLIPEKLHNSSKVIQHVDSDQSSAAMIPIRLLSPPPTEMLLSRSLVTSLLLNPVVSPQPQMLFLDHQKHYHDWSLPFPHFLHVTSRTQDLLGFLPTSLSSLQSLLPVAPYLPNLLEFTKTQPLDPLVGVLFSLHVFLANTISLLKNSSCIFSPNHFPEFQAHLSLCLLKIATWISNRCFKFLMYW